MKILVTGSNGQLGNEIREIAKTETRHDFIFTDVAELDICDANAVNAFVENHRPDFIVNCAAYTAVTKAENDLEFARRINRDAVANLGQAAKSFNAKLIHVSTDYVFDGTGHIPYTEDQATNPQTVYGITKLEGEEALKKTACAFVILRTSWLYSSFGNNFVKTMIRLGKEKDQLSVIYDQIGDPTYAADLASAIMTIINADKFVEGIYHFSNEGVCSWYDFTKVIHQLSGITTCNVLPIATKDYMDKTPRPFYSVLDKSKIKETYNIQIPYWMESLARCVRLLQQKEA
ncbi:MAG: dTDP-4-dehydrorhamnose reductase [Paludibacteraceae bacterium]|nr:dTDP-4-dehydrorhamnose reductase [Paludibacteraceae bacterium]